MLKGDSGKAEAYFLAIETSGRVGSAALGRGPSLVEEIVFSGKMRHSSELFPTIHRLLKTADCPIEAIETLCFTAGPGSFTGLRIGVTMAKMLNFAQKTRLIAVDTLDAIAENATEYIENTGEQITKIAAILDAKQNQFFTAIYKRRNNKWEKEVHDTLIRSEVLIKLIKEDPSGPTILLGDGLFYYKGLFQSYDIRILPEEYWAARARNVLKIGYSLAKQKKFSDPVSLVPWYIRPPDAIAKQDNKNVP